MTTAEIQTLFISAPWIWVNDTSYFRPCVIKINLWIILYDTDKANE